MAQWDAERLRMFREGVGLCFSRWTALNLAVENQWGGRNSSQKAEKLREDVIVFITQSRETRYIDELEDLLDESLTQEFNAELDDGSIEEVAETVMLLNEECLAGNFERVQKLALPVSGAAAAQRSVCENQEAEEDDSSSAEEMEVEKNSSVESGAVSGTVSSEKQGLSEAEVADGWQLVQPRGKGRRSKNV